MVDYQTQKPPLLVPLSQQLQQLIEKSTMLKSLLNQPVLQINLKLKVPLKQPEIQSLT